MGSISGMVDHPGAAITGTLLRDVFFEEPIKLMVESTKQFQLGSDRQHQSQVGLVLITESFLLAHDEIPKLSEGVFLTSGCMTSAIR